MVQAFFPLLLLGARDSQSFSRRVHRDCTEAARGMLASADVAYLLSFSVVREKASSRGVRIRPAVCLRLSRFAPFGTRRNLGRQGRAPAFRAPGWLCASFFLSSRTAEAHQRLLPHPRITPPPPAPRLLAVCAPAKKREQIMLNTDLHNPNIRPEKRMSCGAFVENNRNYGGDISGGHDLPRDFLESVYTSVKEQPIATFEGGPEAPVTANG